MIFVQLDHRTRSELKDESINVQPMHHKYDNAARAFFNTDIEQTIRAQTRCILSERQYADPFLNEIKCKLRGITIKNVFDGKNQKSLIYKRYEDEFNQEEGTDVLTILMNSQIKLVVPFKLRPAYLKQVFHHMNHNGIARMMNQLKKYWWESKDENIKVYAKSSDLCARRKVRYGKRVDWPIGHCRRGTLPFQRVFTDLVHMQQSKGKRYTLTILDSYSRYFMAIPTANEKAIDAVRGLYQLYLKHKVMQEVVSRSCNAFNWLRSCRMLQANGNSARIILSLETA